MRIAVLLDVLSTYMYAGKRDGFSPEDMRL